MSWVRRMNRKVFEAWPQLTYHYGLSPQELVRIPHWLLEIYVDALPDLLMQDQARAVEAASFPHMDKNAQRSVQERIRRSFRKVEDPRPVQALSAEDEMASFARMGIGFEVVNDGSAQGS